jgi:hypothetical protein
MSALCERPRARCGAVRKIICPAVSPAVTAPTDRGHCAESPGCMWRLDDSITITIKIKPSVLQNKV